ncbi:MAG: DNA translocase FtsK 4TM domain-containing protein [Acidimicrobiales bacterium]
MGLGILALAAVTALAIYASGAGPAGEAIDRVTGSLVGVGRFGLPPLIAGTGILVLWRRPPEHAARLAAGVVIETLAGAGLVQLAAGPASPGAVGDSAGGLVGRLAAEPLRAVLGGWGSAAVLAAVAGVGALVIARTSVRSATARAVSVGRSTGRALSGAGDLFDRVVPPPTERPPRREAEDPDSDDREARAARRRRGRKEFDDGAPAGLAANGMASGVRLELFDIARLEGSTHASGDDRDGAGLAGAARDPSRLPISLDVPGDIEPDAPTPVAPPSAPSAGTRAWVLPSLDTLARGVPVEIDPRVVEAEGRTLEAALAAHGVETDLVGMTVGPTVTRYELALGSGVKVARVTNLHKDIAYAMASADVRILAPIPGRSAIGVEVPNRSRQKVTLGDILGSSEARKAAHPLEVAMGRDIAGRPVMVNLAEAPHLLIAGATGAGKSSCINSLITSVLVRSTPDQVRLILVDPKRVELGQYNGLPHLLTGVVVNPKKAANALDWAVREMERRYDILAEVGVRDITGYNAAIDRGDLSGEGPSDCPGDADGVADGTGADVDGDARTRARSTSASGPVYERLPFILVVVDELNDLMMVAARDVETSICRIAQMARAVGIHLVIATQRPSVDVITGVIKANIPSRLAFAVSSLADSRVILDQPGAERLVGQGDMLLAIASSSVPRRVQGSWVDEDEVRRVVAHWRRQSGPAYIDGVEGEEPGTPGAMAAPGDEEDETVLEAALDLVVRSQLGSTSMLQRKLRVGFARAGRLMDQLERRGVVGPSEGSKARAVLMTVEELEARNSRA